MNDSNFIITDLVEKNYFPLERIMMNLYLV
jgi:hypothetical protein